MFHSIGNILVQLYLLLGIVLVSLAPIIPLLNNLKKHGRTLTNRPSPWLISKNYFEWFYLIGIMIAPLVIIQKQTLIVYLFTIVHLLRRFYETKVMFKSTTKMHIIHALVGISFYPVVWFIIYQSEIAFSLVSCTGFAACCLGQHFIHKLLSSNKEKNKLPNHWIFRIFICPNYTLEVLIYVFLHLSLNSWNSLLLLVFVLVNQTISALDRKSFYSSSNSWAIFPYI